MHPLSPLPHAFRPVGGGQRVRVPYGWTAQHGYALHNGVSTRHADDHNADQAHLDPYEAEGSHGASKTPAIEESLHRMTFTDRPGKDDDRWWDDRSTWPRRPSRG